MMAAGGGFMRTVMPDGTEIFHADACGERKTQLIAVPRHNVHVVDTRLSQRQHGNADVFAAPVAELLHSGSYAVNQDERTGEEVVEGTVDGYRITARIPPALPLPGQSLKTAF